MKPRLFLIIMIALLMLGAVYIVGTTLYEEGQIAPVATSATSPTPSIPVERGVFSRSAEALSYHNMPESKRSLSTYYNNRAYLGAPPSIPHPLLSEKGIGGRTCLQCHQNGGYVDQFEAFAPVTPHPELINCKQCHLPKNTENLFKSTNWQRLDPPALKQVAMPGAPPVIPHELDMRSNCLSCHAGAAAPKEIRVSHPERVNCRQCHLPKNTNEKFVHPHFRDTLPKRFGSFIQSAKPALKDTELAQISDWINNENH